MLTTGKMLLIILVLHNDRYPIRHQDILTKAVNIGTNKNQKKKKKSVKYMGDIAD